MVTIYPYSEEWTFSLTLRRSTAKISLAVALNHMKFDQLVTCRSPPLAATDFAGNCFAHQMLFISKLGNKWNVHMII